MKMSMKWTSGILAVGMAVGVTGAAAWAQNADAIDNARSVAKSLQQKQANDSDAALNTAGVPASKPASAPAKPQAAPAATKPAAAQPVSSKPSPVAAAPSKAVPAPAAKAAPAKPAPAHAAKATAPKTPAAKPQPAKAVVKTPTAPKADAKTKIAAAPVPAKPVAAAKPAETAKATDAKKPEEKKDDKKDEKKAEDKKWAMSGKRDPFFSPVVQQTGSGCSTGKKCLEIGAINLRGVVKSDNGFIAVVTNNMGKAYFLRENDPVFNGFVMRITGDSVVFQETIEDKLGKPFTREVVKKLFTPAV